MAAHDDAGAAARPPAATLSSTLLDGIRAEQPEAWRRLVHLFTPLVYRWCRGWGVPPGEEDDVVQEVFAGVWKSIGGYRGREHGGGSFRGWLRTVTRRQVADLHDRRRRQPRPAGTPSQEARLEALEARDAAFDDAAEVAAIYQRALDLVSAEITPRTLDIFRRTAIAGEPAPAVAASLGVSVAAIYQAKHRVLSRLREELEGLVD